MAIVWVVSRVARQMDGEVVFVTTEKAFSDKTNAEKFLAGKPNPWQEAIQGFNCYCERVVHETELE